MAKSAKARREERRTSALAVAGDRHPTTPESHRRDNVTQILSKRSRNRPRTMLYGSIAGLLSGAVMVVLSLLSVSSEGRAVLAGPVAPSGSDPRSMGSPDAPVVITEWVDFQCPACRSFAIGREPEIQRLYVDTGKVRIVSRDFAFLGPESLVAAEAARAAADQGRYWDYRRLLFQRQQGENRGAFAPNNLKRFASELGLDQEAFNASLDRSIYRSAVLAEVREGESKGVKATPTLFINAQKIEGVPTMDRLTRLIEEELAKKS